MASRRKARRHALQILFQLDLTPQPVEEAMRSFYESLYSELEDAPPRRDPFVEKLVRGVQARRHRIDELIARHAHNWRLERMPAVDRNVMRMAVYEMTELGSPPAVAINEALELARRFSGEQAVPFINGVLDAIRQELEAAGALPARPLRSRSRETA
ncbi:MAG: transcription antitermination factor NusB [Bryobacterales bacterium]|nr:transcription antitermination factor NusB [Bryobacteraceae bacterium]MDW8131927.1 transcription antitermination factor NusB [Bryobacterales bacterium]